MDDLNTIQDFLGSGETSTSTKVDDFGLTDGLSEGFAGGKKMLIGFAGIIVIIIVGMIILKRIKR